MKYSKRNFACAAVIAGLLLSIAPRAHAQAIDIQMLPPTNFGSTATCTIGGVLFWDTTTSIHCIPGISGDAAGDITVGLGTKGSLIVDNNLFLGATNVTNSAVNLATLYNSGGCTKGEALTVTSPNGFGCLTVADIPSLGPQTVQTCNGAGQAVNYDPVNGFTCQTIPLPAPPLNCTGANALQYSSATGTYSCQPEPVPPVCPDGLGDVALQFNGTGYTCVPPSALGVTPASGAGCPVPNVSPAMALAPAILIPSGVTQVETGSDGCSAWIAQCQSGTWVNIYTLAPGCGSSSGGMEGGGSGD